jgi:hypothetical protein
MGVFDVSGAGTSLPGGIAVHDSPARVATIYPATAPKHDPGRVSDDVARSWAVVVWMLLLVPPLGFLLLDRRHEIQLPLRIAIGITSMLVVGAFWLEVLHLQLLS